MHVIADESIWVVVTDRSIRVTRGDV